jgi:hypothetical protein
MHDVANRFEADYAPEARGRAPFGKGTTPSNMVLRVKAVVPDYK